MPSFPFPKEELEERIKASLLRIKSRICSVCFLGTCYEYLGENKIVYFKCSICGFTKMKKD